MALRKAILGVSATGVAAGGVVLGKVGTEDTLTRRNVITQSLATPSAVLRAERFLVPLQYSLYLIL